MNKIWILAIALVVAGCAAPVPQPVADSNVDDAEACIAAERDGRLDLAVEACRRAWMTARTGAPGTDQESSTLYNLGRLQKRALQLADAEDSLRRSLEIEERLSGRESARTGRRLAELASILFVQRRAVAGADYVERLLAIAAQYRGGERQYVAALCYGYADALRQAGQADRAGRFEMAGGRLGFKRGDFPTS